MKVTIVSSSDSGGAGIAALRLHKALMSCGIDSSMLCLYKTTDTPEVYEYKKSFFAKVIDHLPFIPYKQNKYKKYYPELSKHYECISFPEAIYDISTHPLIQQADIINLHWVGNMLDYSRFFQKVKKPIIWTLHDMNPFLGIAHYLGDRNTNNQFFSLEEKVRKFKLTAINSHSNVSVVNLCQWMREESERSETFINRKHTIIPNSINTSIFKAYDQIEVRRKMNLPIDKPILLFVSQSVDNNRKGFDLLQNAIKRLSNDCFLLVVGEASNDLVNKGDYRFLGSIKEEERMAMVYAAADAFILPSREDNLPNTMVESLCCGTPVISFSNGGMRNHIRTLENGVLVEDTTSDALLNGIHLFLNNIDKFDRKFITKKAHSVFSPPIQAERYIYFFQTILSKRK